LPKKNSLSFLIGPPTAPPPIFLSSFALSWPDRPRKYSFDENLVSRSV
jgi:hypothetical protein